MDPTRWPLARSSPRPRNKLTPYLFMSPEDRPDPELIKQVNQAIEFRNEISHALRNPSGKYRRRSRSNKELSDAYAAALKLLECYRLTFERLPAAQIR